MNGGADYLLGKLLSLVFYVMTLVIYNRVRKEYAGGKIADAVNLIMIFLAILLITDSVDYFLGTFVSVGSDIELIVKILLKLLALSVLFFGGLRFFSNRRTSDFRGGAISSTDPGDLTSPSVTGGGLPAPGDQGSPTTPAVKPTLGRYEIIEQIGKGAMGIVYKGRDPKLQRLTAIKTIRFIDDFDEEKVEKVKAHFYHEAEVVARLSHKNIVKIYDVGEDLDLSYLAMEYLEGESLERSCRAKRPLPIIRAVDIIAQVCDALDYAHAHGIIHRDVKPGNIMVLKSGEVKVTDFGIARAAGSTKTRTGIIKGTPYYMSPEQARGLTLDGTADIFSLGVVLYQVLTGKLPFTGENLAAIMYQTANVDPESPVTYNPEVGRPLVDIINRALAKNPERRYQSAGQMAGDLRRVKMALESRDEDGDLLQKETGRGGEVEISPSLGRGEADRLQTTSAGKREKEDSPQEALDFADLDRVLSADMRAETGSRPTGTVVLQRDANGEVGVTKANDARRDTGPHGYAGANDDAAAAIPLSTSTGTSSYRAVKTADGTRGEDGRRGSTVAEAGGRRGGGGSRPRPMLRHRFVLSGLVGLLLLGAFGGGYFIFWKSQEKEQELRMQEQQRVLFEKIMQEKMLEKQRLANEEKQKQTALEEQKREDDLERQEAQRIIKQKLEEARRKQEAQRRARLEEEERKKREEVEKERLAKELEKKRQAELEARRKAEAERKVRLEKEATETLRRQEIAGVEKYKLAADALRRGKKYFEAGKAYEKALEMIDKSRFRSDAVLAAYRREIETALGADDIVYGSKGYVLYKGEWMTPEAEELARYSEGYVKYKGKFVQYTTLAGTLDKLCSPQVEKYLAQKYSGQTVHSKNIVFQKAVLNRNNADFSEYSVFHNWKVWTFRGVDEGLCVIDVRYTVSTDRWSLLKGCE